VEDDLTSAAGDRRIVGAERLELVANCDQFVDSPARNGLIALCDKFPVSDESTVALALEVAICDLKLFM